MAIPLDQYIQNGFRKLSLRKKEYNRKSLYNTLGLLAIFATFIIIIANFQPFYSKNYIIIASIFILAIIYPAYNLKKLQSLALSTKEELYFSIANGIRYLQLYIEKDDKKYLKKAIINFQNITSELYKIDIIGKGFENEKEMNKSLALISEYVESKLLPKLNESINQDIYNDLFHNLNQIYIELQNENFKQIDKLIKSWHIAKSKISYKEFFKNLTDKTYVMIIISIIIIVSVNFILAFSFNFFGFNYKHEIGLPAIIAFLATYDKIIKNLKKFFTKSK